VTDEQYDWLVEFAIEEEGDMSEAIRQTIDMARIFSRIFNSVDPIREVRELLRQRDEDLAREEMEDREREREEMEELRSELEEFEREG
jgi:hypothetical protein